MIHLQNKAYLLAPGEEVPGEITFTQSTLGESLMLAYKVQGRLRLRCESQDFSNLLQLHWKSVLQDSSFENISCLYSLSDVDGQLKGLAALPKLSQECLESKPLLRPPEPEDLSFEFILASYFMWPDLVWPVMQKKIEYFCWEQIIQEISVIRQEANLLIYNRKINNFFPAEFHLDHNEDIEIQIYNNPYLNWLFDEEYRFSNVEHFKKNVNLEMVTHFYDCWMMSRRRETFKEEPDHSMDNLKWITGAIARGDWKMLLESNLARNFGCVYLDNTMIPKANQVWASALYRDYAKKDLSTARKLCLRPELFS